MASTHDDPVTTIIKSDRVGRPHYTQQFKDEVLAGYDASGMRAPAFAEQCGIKYPTFAGWLAKRKREAAEGSTTPGQSFVLAKFSDSQQSDTVRITRPGGAAAELATTTLVPLLAALIKALA